MNEKPFQSDVALLRLDVKKIFRGVLMLGLLLLAMVAMMIQPEQYDPEHYAYIGVNSYLSLLRKELGIVDVVHVAALCALWGLFDRVLLRKEQPFCMTAFLVGGLAKCLFAFGR